MDCIYGPSEDIVYSYLLAEQPNHIHVVIQHDDDGLTLTTEYGHQVAGFKIPFEHAREMVARLLYLIEPSAPVSTITIR